MSKRYAICIGVDHLAHSSDLDLSFARSDAEEVAKILKDSTRGRFDKVYELFDDQATKDSIRKTIDTVLLDPHSRAEDLVLIYFAGHGVRDKHEDLCLVPYDFRYQEDGVPAYSSMVHAKELEISINNSSVKNIVLMIDCCYSGALGRILGDINKRQGLNLFVIGGAQATQSALEDVDTEHGVFTECLLRALNLAPDRGDWVSLARVVSFVTDEIKKFPTYQLVETTSHFVDLNLPLCHNPSYSLQSESFTGAVMHTFELARYVTHTAPDWCNYPNLFIAEMRAGFQSTFTAVLCLDNKTKGVAISASHIDVFLSVVRQLRNDGDVGEGMLITENEILNKLSRAIEQTGYTTSAAHGGLIRQVIDFGPYLHRLISEFDQYDSDRPEEPPLSEYYVELDAEYRDDDEKLQQTRVSPYVEDWLLRKQWNRQLALLGEYGTGKTTICKKLARDLAKAYLRSGDKSRHRIPILISLREFPRGQADIEVFISGHLARRCLVSNSSFEAFKSMNDAGLLFLILDGFDEMAVNVDEDIIQANLAQIDLLTTSPNSKLLLTSRPEYFLTTREEREALRPSGLLTRRGEYDRLDLLPFHEEHIRSFIEKKIRLMKNAANDWKYYYDSIKRIHDLSDLSRRPVMLEMIIKTLPELLARDVPVDRPLLYQTYLNGEISRQAIEKRRELLIKRDDRFRMMQTLAVYLYMENLPGITADLIQVLMYDEFSPQQREELEAHTRDFLTCSFLGRRGDKYSFSHRSFVEYLTARGFLEDIQKEEPSRFGKQLLTPEVVDFLVELNPNRPILHQWLHSTRYRGFETVRYLGSNAATVLSAVGEDLAGTDMSGTVLRGARLIGANLTGAVFAKGDLASSNLTGAILDKCNFEESDLTKAKLISAHGHAAFFKNAILDRTDLSNADLSRSDLTNVLCYDSNFENAITDHAKLGGFSLSSVSKASTSLLLALIELNGDWITTDIELGTKPEELILLTNRRTGELRGNLDFRQSRVVFTGILEKGKYILQGQEIEKRDDSKRRPCFGSLYCDDVGTLVVEITASRSDGATKRQRRFRRI